MNISAWAIRRPIPSLLLFLVLMVMGWISFTTLPITRFPNIDVPVVQVMITQSGAAPAELETQVTKKGRGRHRGHHRREASKLVNHRRLIGDVDRIPP